MKTYKCNTTEEFIEVLKNDKGGPAAYFLGADVDMHIAYKCLEEDRKKKLEHIEWNQNCIDYSPTEELAKLREQKKVLQEVFPNLEHHCEFLRALEKFSSNTSYDKDLLTPALELHRSILRDIGEMIYDFYSALSDKEEIIEDVRTSDIAAQRIIKGEKTISHEEIKQKLGM